MRCFDCKWDGRCDGAVCYYDWLREQRMARPDYDEKKYYKVRVLDMCAYRQAYSAREVDDFMDKNPDNDIVYFLTIEEIERDDMVRWEDDDIWRQRGRETAWSAVSKNGLSAVYEWYSESTRDDFKSKEELGFYDEIIRLVRRAKKHGMLSSIKL